MLFLINLYVCLHASLLFPGCSSASALFLSRRHLSENGAGQLAFHTITMLSVYFFLAVSLCLIPWSYISLGFLLSFSLSSSLRDWGSFLLDIGKTFLFLLVMTTVGSQNLSFDWRLENEMNAFFFLFFSCFSVWLFSWVCSDSFVYCFFARLIVCSRVCYLAFLLPLPLAPAPASFFSSPPCLFRSWLLGQEEENPLTLNFAPHMD